MLARIKRRLNVPHVRYLAASIAAVLVDYVVSTTIHLTTSLPLSTSAAIGFIIVGAIFYFVHEHWSFRRANSAASAKRLTQNLIVLGLALSGRVCTIALLEAVQRPNLFWGAIYFGLGAGVSFAIGYLMNRFWVFR